MGVIFSRTQSSWIYVHKNGCFKKSTFSEEIHRGKVYKQFLMKKGLLSNMETIWIYQEICVDLEHR